MDKIALAGLAITRGTILHGPFDGINHSKFFVIMGEKYGQLVGFFFINSNIHQSIKDKQPQLDMQMPIKKEDYAFLTHTSFIGANHLGVLDKNKLACHIAGGVAEIKGNLTEADMDMLLDAARKSKLFSKIEKETFFK